MSEVLKFFREEIDPRFGDVNDRELSDFIKNEYPDFLQDEGFKSFVSEMESTPPDIPDELTGSEDSFLEKIFNKLNSGKVGMEPTGGVTFDVNPITQQFDPEGEGYNYKRAKELGITPDDTGHWPSRDPDSGEILKGRKHKTFDKTLKGEEDAGYEIVKGYHNLN